MSTPAARFRRRALTAARVAGLRTSFRILEVVAPRRAGVRAFVLWCTLPGNPGRRKDFRAGPGEVVRVEAPRGGSIVAEVWGEGPTVYLVHGWGGWRGQLGAFVAPLVDAGFRVVGFDAPGHGDSDPGVMGPGRGTLVEVVEALEVVGQEFGEAAGIVAHSMGCTAASMAVRKSLPAASLVLVAPNHDFDEITRDFARVLGLSERTRRLLHDAIRDFTQRPISDFDLEPQGADGRLPDTLILHDRLDKETPYEVSVGLAGSWPGSTLVTTEGLGHQRILADPTTIATAVEHIRERVPAAVAVQRRARSDRAEART